MSVKDSIHGQFRRPHGLLGRLAGLVMAGRGSNVERNRVTVDLLDPQPGDRVLEVGHGPGLAVAALAGRVEDGHVVGLDHSVVMHDQASRRNRRAVEEGRVELVVGSLNDLGDAQPFDRIMLVNVAMFWDEPVRELERLRSLLVPGGRLAVTHQPRNAKATAEDTDRAAQVLASQLQEAGFVGLEVDTIDLAGVPGVCVRAQAQETADVAGVTNPGAAGATT